MGNSPAPGSASQKTHLQAIWLAFEAGADGNLPATPACLPGGRAGISASPASAPKGASEGPAATGIPAQLPASQEL